MFSASLPKVYLCVPRLGSHGAEQISPPTEVPGVLLATLALDITVKNRGPLFSVPVFYKIITQNYKIEKKNRGKSDIGPGTKTRD